MKIVTYLDHIVDTHGTYIWYRTGAPKAAIYVQHLLDHNEPYDCNMVGFGTANQIGWLFRDLMNAIDRGDHLWCFTDRLQEYRDLYPEEG